MRFILFIFLLCSSLFISSDAWATRYTSRSLKKYVLQVPRREENNISSLVNYLTKRLDDDYDKAKVIAFWIASHINYDEYLYHDGKTSKLINTYHGQSSSELLKSRAGICGDFAQLFEDMCRKAGIRAYQVHGYASAGTSIRREKYSHKFKHNAVGHAWNYFIYKNRNIYVDTTFMAHGTTGVSRQIGNFTHKRALNEIKRENRYKSQINDFDEYYFDFDYEDEPKDKGYIRFEK